MPHLAANFSFGLYFKNLNKMKHYIGKSWGNTSFTVYNNSITLSYTDYSTLTTLTQCNITRGSTGLKFVSGNPEKCAAITSCNGGTLKARYCKDEAKGIVCSDDYHWGKFNFILFF